MSQIVNISLGPTDPNPGNYTVSVKDCDVTTYTDVASSLTFSDFPFQFDVESFITGTCFEYQVIDMDSGAICYASANIPTTPSPTPTNTPATTPTPTPTPSVLSDCVSGTTNGDYQFIDCCGVTQRGSSLGVTFCVATSYPYSGVNLTNLPCVPSCDDGPLQVDFTLTAACPTTGSVTFNVNGGTKPYFVENIFPTNSGIGTQQGDGPLFTFTGLSEGTYTFNISDSTNPARQFSQSIFISSCFEVDISSVQDADCGDEFGSLTLTGNSGGEFPWTGTVYYNGAFLDYYNITTNPYTITPLPPGSYYVVVETTEPQTATTSTQVISSTSGLTFGIAYTGTSSCGRCVGQAEVTGTTGVGPYTYTWNNGQTTPIATGLCQDNYSVTVVDSNGCQNTENVSIPTIPPPSFNTYSGTQPNCFSCDGEITVGITGGTPPYIFSASTSYQETNSSGSFTLNGLCGGQYTIQVTDNNGCVDTQGYTLNSSSGINSVIVTPTDSDCGGNGSIKVEVDAIIGSLTYSLSGSNGNEIQTVTTNNQTYTFENLSADTYTIKVISANGCIYTTTTTINDNEKYTVSTTTTSTTCGVNNGSATINVSDGTSPIQYPLTYIVKRISDGSIVYSSIGSLTNSEIVSNLSSGSYEIIITDNGGCSSTNYFTIEEGSGGVQAILYSTPCVSGNDGTASLSITDGIAPFTITWSSNVPNSQTGQYLTGLSGDTYTATIVDSEGCSIVKSVTVVCDDENVDDYVINTLCEQDFVTTSEGKRGFYEMLNEAFLDLNQPGNGCYLESAVFTGVLTISGGSYGVGQTIENEFYTGYTLNDVPSDNEWEIIVQGMLSQFSGITYTTDLLNNIFTVKGNCEGDIDPLNGAFIELKVEIEINVNCAGRIGPVSPTPTPTITPTTTPTITITPSITSTPGATPTTTPSLTITPTPSSTIPSYDCTLTVIGSSRQLSCVLDVNGSVTSVAYDLISTYKSI